MRVTEISVSAGRKIPHPYEQHGNLTLTVTLKAELADGEHTEVNIGKLREQVEMYADMHREYTLVRIHELHKQPKPKPAGEPEGLPADQTLDEGLDAMQGKYCSESQVLDILAAKGTLGLSDKEFTKRCRNNYGIKEMTDVQRLQPEAAGKLLDTLNNAVKAQDELARSGHARSACNRKKEDS